MRVLLEGSKYNIEELKEVFDDPKFYTQDGLSGTVNSVGYYHSFVNNTLIYMLPKVFLGSDGMILGCTPEELFRKDMNRSFKHSGENLWTRQLLVYFYNSLAEFRSRYKNSGIIENSETFELNTNLGVSEYSYMDLLLSFINFYKKNKNTILYHHIEYTSNIASRSKWDKTIRKSIPILSNNVPIYLHIKNKSKTINDEEELLCYYFSILNHFKKEHNLPIVIDKSYKTLTGPKFKKLEDKGLSQLRKIKHRYFSDTLKRMYKLCELYFSKTDKSSKLKKREEFISARNYNIVFEDMIDKIFSTDIYNDKTVDDITLDKLKHNADGKIIDHIYDYKSLIDNTNIFYIGDSKYYKPTHQAGRLSIYKQFTYAKNVIQFNIDLLNRSKSYENVRYRDSITEGYNISPNFFIYGFIDDMKNFDEPLLKSTGTPQHSYHFEDRLFDRDSLFVIHYRINFLYVLKAYTSVNHFVIKQFRASTKDKFRNEFVSFFNSSLECPFKLYEKEFSKRDLNSFISDNFRALNGKCITINDTTLLLAEHIDYKLESLRAGFEPKILS
ncbi:hypothetical protein R1T16_04220 [Flavobacterium sp. DG1-102-2]|uniref:hypothetical protein n=1 Tax=Flavobacterium sp. DG1-102-2 TaxID=3081663 RepID=UPI002949DC55|nr:hypothetical protein [Flavobacterium sp. DG1-102-2]MDV6167616.1 hypothetical protein [Flavobacterium sp. DG1-102-2]